MPFVTEFNMSRILENATKDLDVDEENWKPYHRLIYFLNRKDLKDLYNFQKFTMNPDMDMSAVYRKIEVTGNNNFVYSGGAPSYHKLDNCERLTSDYVNFPIPEKIKVRGDEEVKEYRIWFKENLNRFAGNDALYSEMMLERFGVTDKLIEIHRSNSGYIYKENLSVEIIDIRINSILKKAALYFNEDIDRQPVIRKYQKRTFLAFSEDLIDDNDTGYSDAELKIILREYKYLFIDPTIFYLKERYKILANKEVEIEEKIFTAMNFRRCGLCYNDSYVPRVDNDIERLETLKERFGDYEFPREPALFKFKINKRTGVSIAFIYARVFRCLTDEFSNDNLGSFKMFKIEFIDKYNRYFYAESKIYADDIPLIKLFEYYITEIQHLVGTNKVVYITYSN